MPLRGSIYLTTDFNVVLTNAITHNIICISGETELCNMYFGNIKYNNASILLPPYDALAAEVDGEMEIFQNIYFDHLSKQLQNELIVIILRAIYNGKHILLYLTPQEFEMSYIKYFCLFFNMVYGITIGDNMNPYFFNENFYPQLLTTMYMNNLMSHEEYLKEYPILFNPYTDNFQLIKLVEDISPYGVDNLEKAAEYFNAYKLECIKYNKELEIPVRGVGK